MNAPPVLAPGGSSPVVIYLRHSMIVLIQYIQKYQSYCLSRTIVTDYQCEWRSESEVNSWMEWTHVTLLLRDGPDRMNERQGRPVS